MLCLRETTSGISSCMVDAAQASHVPARQRTDQVAQHRRQPKHVSLHISQQGTPAPTPTANSPLHVPPDSRIQSSLAVRSRPNHGANSVPPWYCQEDREGAFEPADEQECGYTGTSDGIPENRSGAGKPCKSRRLTCNTDLPQLCVVYARVRTDHLTLFHYAMATRRASLVLRYAM
jgi:hypothetical protein